MTFRSALSARARSLRARSLRIGVLAALVAFGAAQPASAEAPTIYKWVDQNGVAHYTTDRGRIPREIRTRVERSSTSSSAPDVAAPPHREDVLRDVIPAKPKTPVAAPAASRTSAVAPAPAPAAAPIEPAASEPLAAVEELAPPLSSDAPEPVDEVEIDPVSAPPPAPVAPLGPQQTAELAKLDGQIESLEGEIAKREEKLAALISTSDDQRSTPLVDDPGFREISQRLPKLQAELQTLRERRNKIQPPATP